MTTPKANNTWSIIDLLSGKYPIDYKWVFKVKYLALVLLKGTIQGLLLKVFVKRNGWITLKPFLLWIKWLLLGLLLLLVVAKGWLVLQIDVHNVFCMVI